MRNLVYDILVREEGVRLEPYQDHLSFWTIGIGHLIDRRKGGSLPSWIKPSFPLTRSEVDELCYYDIAEKETGLSGSLGWWPGATEVTQVVLVLMAFQMGVDGVLRFPTMLGHLRAGQHADAALAMLDSKWARVQTPSRARRLSIALRTQNLGGL